MKQTLQRFGLFLRETAIRIKSKTPGYFRSLGRYLLAIAVTCAAFQNEILVQIEKIIGLNLFPEPWVQKLLSVVGLLAMGGKLITLLPADRTRLTPEQRYALEQIEKAKKHGAAAGEDSSGTDRLLVSVVVVSLTLTSCLLWVLLFADL